MSSTDQSSRPGYPRRDAQGQVGGDLRMGLVPLLIVAGATWRLLGLPSSYLVHCLGLYGVTGFLILRHPPTSLVGPGLGPANRITLLRATLLLPMAALAFHREALAGTGVWWVVLVSAFILILDGVDGRTARRTGSTTAFGARFDMEVDAFHLLALSILVWSTGKVGNWVVLVGALRYLFAAAGWIWPALQADLPPNQRRRATCLIQGLALLVALAPITSSATASPVVAAALALLIYSFGADTTWLVRSARRSGWSPDSSTAV